MVHGHEIADGVDRLGEIIRVDSTQGTPYKVCGPGIGRCGAFPIVDGGIPRRCYRGFFVLVIQRHRVNADVAGANFTNFQVACLSNTRRISSTSREFGAAAAFGCEIFRMTSRCLAGGKVP